MSEERSQRRVVCAACKHKRYPDMPLMIGPRHFDSVMRQQINVYNSHFGGLMSSDWDQGFIDQFGAFMGRKEAMQIAKAAGQPIDIERGCGGDSETLYSEGLY